MAPSEPELLAAAALCEVSAASLLQEDGEDDVGDNALTPNTSIKIFRSFFSA